MTDFVITFKDHSKSPRGKTNTNELHQNSPEQSSSKCCFHYLHFILQAGFYCGVIPFQLKFNHETSHYQLSKVTNIFQKMAFMLALTLPFLGTVKLLRKFWVEESARHLVTYYFHLVNYHWYALWPIVHYKTVYANLAKMQFMLESIAHNSLLKLGGKHRKIKWVIFIGCQVTYLVVVLLREIFGTANGTQETSYTTLVKNGRELLFLSGNSTIGKFEEITTMNVLAAMLDSCVILTTSFRNVINLCVLGISAFSIWCAASSIVKEAIITTSEDKTVKRSVNQLREKYSELVDLVRTINVAWSLFFFWYIMDVCLYFSTALHAISQKGRNLSFGVPTALFLVCFMGALVLSAEACRMNRWLGNYLKDQMYWKQPTRNTQMERSWTEEVQKTSICIGEKKFFEVDYVFIGQMCIAVGTFLVITLQLGHDSQEVS